MKETGSLAGRARARTRRGRTSAVLSTTNLADWTHAEEATRAIDGNGQIAFPNHDEAARFYRLKAEE